MKVNSFLFYNYTSVYRRDNLTLNTLIDILKRGLGSKLNIEVQN
ncbi:hypothetical protein M141_0383 [Bacteroides fragilis str. S38L5]|nr:hypothetical protein M069_0432 [Bacteroides fragilis str. B1 (UDC16-1)]EYA97534.1 hypothetical protein M141_0383 [Bacteroides fragilis str. S38L5]EYB15916.1 hypothetical protein M140_0333 [Bacteroides fragilis str. S38L3]